MFGLKKKTYMPRINHHCPSCELCVCVWGGGGVKGASRAHPVITVKDAVEA
jgi:hypothetical protein